MFEAEFVFVGGLRVEPWGLESIARAREAYLSTDLRQRLARHHGANTDVAFWGWNDVWLHPEFRAWNIEEFLPAIQAPMLILQGERDGYGTWRQVEAIQRQSGGPVEARAIPDCGHAPHREHPELTLQAMASFVAKRRVGQ